MGNCCSELRERGGTEAITKHLQDLLEAAKNVVLTPGEKQQRPIRVLRSAQSPRLRSGLRQNRAGSSTPSRENRACWGPRFRLRQRCNRKSRITREMLPPITPKPGVLGPRD